MDGEGLPPLLSSSPLSPQQLAAHPWGNEAGLDPTGDSARLARALVGEPHSAELRSGDPRRILFRMTSALPQAKRSTGTASPRGSAPSSPLPPPCLRFGAAYGSGLLRIHFLGAGFLLGPTEVSWGLCLGGRSRRGLPAGATEASWGLPAGALEASWGLSLGGLARRGLPPSPVSPNPSLLALAPLPPRWSSLRGKAGYNKQTWTWRIMATINRRRAMSVPIILTPSHAILHLAVPAS